jgi:chromosome condensin MukBEF ATPase and DNA-binding subunit MukB
MRRALGLSAGSGQHTPQQRPEQARARHRFVQDGGVPVVMLNAKIEPETAALREKITSLESALEHERHQNEQLRRQLKDNADQVTALQTRLAHSELAHKDTLEQERHLRITAQEALQEALAAAPVRRRTAQTPTPVDDTAAAFGQETATFDSTREQVAAQETPPVVKRGRGRPRSTALPEPKPVRWWTPSYRTKTKA